MIIKFGKLMGEYAESMAAVFHLSDKEDDGTLHLVHVSAVAGMSRDLAIAEGKDYQLTYVVGCLHDALAWAPDNAAYKNRYSCIMDAFPITIMDAIEAITPNIDEEYLVYVTRLIDNTLATLVKRAELTYSMNYENLKFEVYNNFQHLLTMLDKCS